MAFTKQRIQKLESKLGSQQSEPVKIVVSKNPGMVELWFGKDVVYLDRTAAEKYGIKV